MAILNINSIACAFGDIQATSNPKRKYFDWQTNLNGVIVSNPKSEQYVVPAQQSFQLFNGIRATTLDATTSLSISFIEDSRYRITYDAGTDPSFATNRPLAFAATDFTITANDNQTATIVGATGTPFAGILVGDTFYVKGLFDGYVTAFNPDNQGEWKVLSASNTQLILARPQGTSFTAFTETQIGRTSADFLAYRLSVVQVGDKLSIQGGFQDATCRIYSVTQVTSKWIEIVSGTPIAEEAGIFPNAAFVFYSASKRFIRIEVDQDAKVYLNGSTDENQHVQPWVAGDPDQTAWIERVGPTWSATIYNRSLSPMIVNVFSVE